MVVVRCEQLPLGLIGVFLSDLSGAPFRNITDRDGNVIPGTESHGIFPYARTFLFGINGEYCYVRPSIFFQPAQGHEKP